LLKLDFSVFTLHLILTCAFIVMPVLLVENNIVATDLKDNWSVYLPVILLSITPSQIIAINVVNKNTLFKSYML
jgi:hypothetical protein